MKFHDDEQNRRVLKVLQKLSAIEDALRGGTNFETPHSVDEDVLKIIRRKETEALHALEKALQEFDGVSATELIELYGMFTFLGIRYHQMFVDIKLKSSRLGLFNILRLAYQIKTRLDAESATSAPNILNYELHPEDDSRYNVFHYVVRGDHLDCLKFLLVAEKKLCEFLLLHPSVDGYLPIEIAASEGAFDCLRELCERSRHGQGFDFESKVSYETLMHLVVRSRKGRYLDCLKYLAEEGADLQARNSAGHTLRDVAIMGGKGKTIVDFIDDFLNAKTSSPSS